MTVTSAFLLFVISLFHTTLLHRFTFYEASPDVYLMFSIFFSINSRDIKRATFLNWCNGITKDILSEGFFGLSAILFIVIGYILNKYKDVVFKEHLLTQILITFLSALFYNFVYAVITVIGASHIGFTKLVLNMVTSSLYTAVVSLFLFTLFNMFRLKLGLDKSLSFGKKH